MSTLARWRYLWTWIGDEWVVESVAHLTLPKLGDRFRQLEAQGYKRMQLAHDDEVPPARPREKEARR